MIELVMVHIETTAHCQLECEFCPHKTMKRPMGIMSDELFDKILNDISYMQVEKVMPFLFGEPFLDKKIYSRVERIKEVLPGMPISLFSNGGVPIDETKAGMLKDIGIVISYTLEADAEVRDRNVEILKKAGVAAIEVHVVGEGTMMTPLVRYAEGFGRKHVLPVLVFGKYNWAGKIRSRMTQPDGHCCRPRAQICVMWDGRVALCCADIDCEICLGDVRTTSLKDIWESDKFRMYREKKKSELDFCKVCNMQNDGPGES